MGRAVYISSRKLENRSEKLCACCAPETSLHSRTTPASFLLESLGSLLCLLCRPKFKRLGHDNKQPLNPQLFFSSFYLSLSQFRGEEAEGLLTRFWDALTGPTPGGSRSRLTLRFVHCPPAAAAPAVPTRSPQRNGPQFALIFGGSGLYFEQNCLNSHQSFSELTMSFST